MRPALSLQPFSVLVLFGGSGTASTARTACLVFVRPIKWSWCKRPMDDMDANRERNGGNGGLQGVGGGAGVELRKESRNAQNDPKKAIRTVYECIRKILEIDTENVVSDLNVMESVNNVAILRFRDLGSYINELHEDSKLVQEAENSIAETLPALLAMEKQVDAMHSVAVDLNEWSQEVEVKLQRAL
jgi:hypothetical protein